MLATDETLVGQCRSGDREAFAEIVRRYQRLICSIAYGATGNLIASEELAQDAFVSAWRSMPDLREPHKLRQWLCGIVRNLARNHTRREHRDVLSHAGAIARNDVADAQAGDPAEATIAQEEAELLDRTLAAMPHQYREPLVLFYRENESVAQVAELLEISPDAVKQRLSRGRKMLREEVAAAVERGLRRSVPGRAFTLGVLAALPVMSGTAKAATLTVSSAKGVSAMNAAGWAGISGAVLGTIAGLLGGWFGYSMSIKSAQSDRERTLIKRMTVWVLGLIAAQTIGLTLLIWKGREWAVRDPSKLAIGIVALVFGYVVVLIGLIFWTNRRLAQVRREDGTVDLDPDDVAAKLPAAMHEFQYPRIHESKARLLGIPLLSVRFTGASAVGQGRRRPAVGWIAIGDMACGIVFAGGPVAVGGVACGGIAVGLVSLAGLAMGGLALGGAAIGWWSLGGGSIGWLAFGGVAVAWKAAMGGMAVAHDYAVGGLAIGEHANDAAAKAFVAENTFFRLGDLMMSPWSWWVLVAITLVPLFVTLKLVPPTKTAQNDSAAR